MLDTNQTKVMSKFLRIIEIAILGMFLGFLPLVICLAGTVFLTGMVFGTDVLGAWALWSLLPGVAIDIVFLKKWVRNAYKINSKILAAIYIFYSVVAIAMGMGVPIFNFALCIAAGLYIARKMHFIGADEQTRRLAFKRMAVFCGAVMALICCLITLWAILGLLADYDNCQADIQALTVDRGSMLAPDDYQTQREFISFLRVFSWPFFSSFLFCSHTSCTSSYLLFTNSYSFIIYYIVSVEVWKKVKNYSIVIIDYFGARFKAANSP
jgi:hypothetical protein